MKQILLKNEEQVNEYMELIRNSANEAQIRLMEVSERENNIGFLERIKFDQIGFDPLDASRNLNLIEQVNQTFTYLASLGAARVLFANHEGIEALKLNLGTSPGPDLESSDGKIVAEVFAATRPSSNDKLNRDIKRAKSFSARYKYVFFMCPGIPEGLYRYRNEQEVIIWSLGV
jgi:hypothetical protein